MKRTITLALLITAISFAQSDSGSNLTVEEVFSVQTSEELEASLTDGYPMPWLAEILNDESIPEEDRYWLDCRVRAMIAQDLHLFYSREGNPVHIDADWIRYGESYWQESFIINPIGEYIFGEINPKTDLWGETGVIYNRYGESTGEIALCEEWMQLSRDGSVGLLIHKGSVEVTESGPVFLFLVYSDGTYFKIPQELGICDYTLSQSGDLGMLVERNGNQPDQIQMFDRTGNLLWEQISIEPTYGHAMISPDDDFCSILSATLNPLENFSHILSATNGQSLASYPESVSFSPDGKKICVGLNYVVSSGNYTDKYNIPLPGTASNISLLSFDNNARIFSGTWDFPSSPFPANSGHMVWSEEGSYASIGLNDLSTGSTLSPNGLFAISQAISADRHVSLIPSTIWELRGDF